MQETTFPVEIFVHDDASTDGTAQIVEEYAVKYPQLFWTVLQTENQWSRGNSKILSEYLARQRGEFVAFCEGDDYWTDRLKLSEQVSLLRTYPEASASFHAASVISEAKQELEVRPPLPVPPRLSFDDVVIWNHILTCSLIFRAAAKPRNSVWAEKLPMGDWPLQVELARHGDLVGVNKNMSCYRRHSGGFWTKQSRYEELSGLAAFYEAVETNFYKCLPEMFYFRLRDQYKECLHQAIKDRRCWQIGKQAAKYFKANIKLLIIMFRNKYLFYLLIGK